MAYADTIRTTAATMELVATSIDGVLTGSSAPLGASTAWTATHTGFSANPTYVAQYWQIGKLVHAFYRSVSFGTSNTTGFTISAPVTARTLANMVWVNRLALVWDNGAYSTSPGTVYIQSAGTVFNILFNQNGSTLWTASGTKAVDFQISYEAA